MAHIVILGAGIGGSSLAYDLKHKLGSKHKVTVINETPKFSFIPSNPWVAVGWRKPEDIEIELAPVLGKKGIEFIDMAAVKVNPEQSSVELKDGRTIHYDYLAITTGARLAFDQVPGLGPDGYTESVCTTSHANVAWQNYQAFLENPGPIVVGAAPGASCYGPAYEMALVIDADLRKRKIRDRVPITFVTPEPYIGHMGLAGVGDSKSLLESKLREHHIKWVANARITQVDKGKMVVEALDKRGNLEEVHQLPFSWSMIIPAFEGVDAIRGLEGLVNAKGFVIIDKHQRNPTYRNIFSAGVCVAIPPIEPTPIPVGAPKTGLMIESMTSAIVENIHADIEGKPANTEATWNALCLADMGDSGMAFVAVPQIPPRNVTWTKSGKWVHWAKVAFEKYHLRKVRTGNTEPFYEKLGMKFLGIPRLKKPTKTS